VGTGVLKDFLIQFSGLKQGIHSFSFHVGDSFFAQFEYSEIEKGCVEVDCSMDKGTGMLVFHFSITGSVKVTCDRCGEEYDQAISGEQQLIVKFGDDYHEETGEVLIIPLKEHQFDVSQLIYEYINLLIPPKRVHGVGENGVSLCNPEMVKILDQLRPEHDTDSRWEALRKLKNKENIDN